MLLRPSHGLITQSVESCRSLWLQWVESCRGSFGWKAAISCIRSASLLEHGAA